MKAIVAVLDGHDDGLRARDIHREVDALLGEPVAVSSFKHCLARNVHGEDALLERVAYGRYRLRRE